jgi:sugar phosphate isomerase/epimerase
MARMGIGVQLYTVRDLAVQDLAGTLKKVADLGYSTVELAGYGNLKSAKDVKKALDDAGLKSPAGHWSIDALVKDFERIMEEAQVLELQHVVVSYLPEALRKDAAAWKTTAKLMDELGSYFHGIGVELTYHNHAFEFEKFGGKFGLDILLENTQAHLVKAEVDVYWVRYAGEDPAALIERLADRVRCLHLKDMAPGDEKRFAPVGEGTIDFKAILAAAGKAGVRWGFVEQDKTYDTPPMDAIRKSFENLKKLEAKPDQAPPADK